MLKMPLRDAMLMLEIRQQIRLHSLSNLMIIDQSILLSSIFNSSEAWHVADWSYIDAYKAILMDTK